MNVRLIKDDVFVKNKYRNQHNDIFAEKSKVPEAKEAIKSTRERNGIENGVVAGKRLRTIESNCRRDKRVQHGGEGGRRKGLSKFFHPNFSALKFFGFQNEKKRRRKEKRCREGKKKTYYLKSCLKENSGLTQRIARIQTRYVTSCLIMTKSISKICMSEYFCMLIENG